MSDLKDMMEDVAFLYGWPDIIAGTTFLDLPSTSHWRWAIGPLGEYVVYAPCEIARWCERQIKKRRGAFFMPNNSRLVVWFEDQSEAAHFKLKWL